MECSDREREIVNVVTIMRHGLTFNKNNSVMQGSNDDVDTLSLLEYFAPHAKSEVSLMKPLETNKISDIFQSFENDCSTIVPKFILIEGAPGMGKTILCKEIAYQWAKQCLLQDTELLFLIHLRDLAITNIKHLKELAHYLYAFDEAATELSKECAKILNEKDGNGLTILFDGFDEFDSSSDSLITNILHRKVLPKCRIVVTSRLTASERLHRLADVRVEVLGFTDESKMQYIKQELKGYPDKICKLQSYFDNHPSIKSICYMPMIMTILVYVFKENGCLPNNLTELYEIFVALTISHQLQKQKKSEHLFTSLQTLPTECKSFLNDLSKFAFITLRSKQKVFGKTDVETHCPNSVLANSSLDSLGLIKSVEYFCISRGHSSVFNFLHLSIHEYLAALHISSIDQCMQFNELEHTFLNEIYQQTWNMFIAMSKRTWLTFQNYFIYFKDMYHESLSNWIANIKSSLFVECIAELYDTVCNSPISSNPVQILFSQDTQPSNGAANAYQQQIYLSLCSIKYVSQIRLQMFIFDKATINLFSNWHMITEKLRVIYGFSVVFCTNTILMLKNINQLDNIDCFKFKTLINCFLLVRCHISNNIIDILNHLNLHNLLRFDIVNCTFSDGDLSDELTLATHSNQALNASQPCNNNSQHLAIVILQALSKISSLKALNLQSNQLGKDAGEYISSIILNSAELRILLLDDNNLGEGLLYIAKALQHHSSLNRLGLSKSVIPKEVCIDLALAIECNLCLDMVKLSSSNLQSSAGIILQALSKISSLKVLDLQSNQLTEDDGKYISSVILNNTGLNQLLLDNNDIGKGILLIAKALQQLKSLQVLGLSYTNMPKESSDDLALAIECNQCLNTIKLHSNNLQSAAIVILQALCNLSSLRVVDLRNNQLTEETGEYLSHLILSNPELNHMNLINNNIGKGVLHIAKALKKVTSLKLLGLDNNSFPAQVCDELALAIQSNQCLQSLWLPCICLNSNVLQSMVTISTLTDLNLNSTQLLEETGEVLSCIILHNTGLEHLYLSNNNLGNGAVHVMKAIQHLTQLRTLHLGNVTSSRVVSEECGEALSYAMSNNNHLEDIDLSNNNLQEVAVHVVKALQQLKSLQVLDLSYTNMPKESSDDLALAIECNQC